MCSMFRRGEGFGEDLTLENLAALDVVSETPIHFPRSEQGEDDTPAKAVRAPHVEAAAALLFGDDSGGRRLDRRASVTGPLGGGLSHTLIDDALLPPPTAAVMARRTSLVAGAALDGERVEFGDLHKLHGIMHEASDAGVGGGDRAEVNAVRSLAHWRDSELQWLYARSVLVDAMSGQLVHGAAQSTVALPWVSGAARPRLRATTVISDGRFFGLFALPPPEAALEASTPQA